MGNALTFGSLFAGVGGFDLALEQAGMICKWQVEIDKRCQEVLKYHWPDVPKFADIKEEHDLEKVDLICGGWPCQDLSVAGKRAGLHGERSGLFFPMAKLIQKLKPRWLILENVPGLFSQNRGQDTALVLKALTEFGYCVAWRVLDAQWFGVAQRRRRVFFVGSLGNKRAAEVLFESQGGCWDSTPSREKKEEIAGTIGDRIAKSHTELDGHGAYIVGPRLTPWDHESSAGSDGGDGQRMPCVCHENVGGEVTPANHARALRAGASHSYQFVFPDVRRLTPTECERLQGFPNGHTSLMSDSARYKMMGNAVAVPVVKWIADRIVMLDK